ncbi:MULTISPECIES: META domain-containing protein [Commensalibacter]|uniref:META domain-containing protein n=1 Tax=Commensalibacter TaxID=1079922 RepID=UPI0012D9197F|nr:MULTISPECIES: META domain-containing protein [Commensalibacter]MUG09928.1 META domain-containing protein [Commensalibacter melissae]MUG35242.1 META domain-containing protein [Commensalibacter sp. ESL0382]
MKKIIVMIFGTGLLGAGINSAFAQDSKSKAPFDESIWRVEHLSHQKTFIKSYQNDQKFTYLSFNPYTHRINGSGLCNKFLGFFQNNGNQITISKIERQQNTCLDPQVNAQDEFFFDKLKLVKSVSIGGKYLRLLDENNKILITAKYFK